MAIEDNGDIVETAGFWTLGVAQGLMTSFIPVLVFSLGVGLMLRLSKSMVRVGSGE